MVKELAENHFSFLKESKAQVDVIVGDGRLVLESQEPQDFDILILDAFSGDAVPVHLLTQEAFAVYLRHIKPKGVIIANITNIHLDLLPVARGIAQQLHLGVAHLPWDPITKPWYLKESDFVAWSRDKDFLQSLENRVSTPWARSKRLDSLLWTDEYASLFPLLKH